MTRAPWTAQDDATLRAAHAAGSTDACLAAFPQRSRSSVQNRMTRLGLQRFHHWTPAEDALLRKLWDGDQVLRDIAKAVGRTTDATYYHAMRLGLPSSVPAGFEYLTVSARRTGYSSQSLRHLLKRSDVRIRRALANPRTRKLAGKAMNYRHEFVWPADVDDAITSWLEREPVNVAARRLGMLGTELERLLRAAGIEKPTEKRQWWRVSEDEVARAIGRSQERAA